MTIRHGKIQVLQQMGTNFTKWVYDIYEKTEGDYKEFLINESLYESGFVENDVQTIIEKVEEVNYKVIPQTTLEDIIDSFPMNDFITHTWLKEMTTI